jgi:hypothetical protein
LRDAHGDKELAQVSFSRLLLLHRLNAVADFPWAHAAPPFSSSTLQLDSFFFFSFLFFSFVDVEKAKNATFAPMCMLAFSKCFVCLFVLRSIPRKFVKQIVEGRLVQ